jgi:UPF0716 family protein affecting phage T7 exclusion
MFKYFILYIFIEVMVSSTIAGEIGGLMTFLELIISAILGIFLLQNFKFSLVDKIKSVREGQLTKEEFVKSSVGAAIGSILLIMPGFFTDIFGLLLQFSIFTIIFTKIFRFRKQKENNFGYNSSNNYNYSNQAQKGDDDVIDVEIIDDDKSIKH